jgi:hypothetical protein
MTIKNRSNVEPTLFIGLGGSGGKILGRLKKTFEHEFRGTEEKDSSVQFLLLDTDDFQKLDETVSDSLDEQEDFLTISHFNPRHYIDEHRRDHRSDLHRWFDWDARPLLEDAFVRDGASRLRILGRLCFHRSYYHVEKILAEKISRAKSAKAYVEGGGRLRPTERPFRVVIITSTCGGTGSGIFLDLVHMLNRLIRSSGSTPDVLGFLFLPFWFIDANRQIDTDLVPYYQANAWAFFEELNHVLLQPARLAEIALDPGRPNGVAIEAGRADYEPLKTVYLLDSEIPNVGRFHDGADWNAYVAQSIFQVFLAPEEGSLESVFSNIKTKLGEVDRRYGLKKRFAALGYADIRHPGAELHGFLSYRAAVQYLRSNLLGRSDAEGVEEASAEIERGIETIVRQRIEPIINAPPPQLDAGAYTMAQGPTKRVARMTALGKVGDHVKEQVAAFNTRLPTQLDLGASEQQAAALIRARIEKLGLGLRGELAVLERVFARLGAEVSNELGGEGAPQFAPPPQLNGVRAIQAELAKKKSMFGGGPSDQPSAYAASLQQINDALEEDGNAYKALRAQQVRAQLLQRIVGVSQADEWQNPLADTSAGAGFHRSVLGSARFRLQRAIADLQGVTEDARQRMLEDFSSQQSLTTRYFPPIQDAEETWSHFRPRYHQILAEQQFDLQRHVRELSQRILVEEHSGRSEQIRATLVHLASFFAGAFHASADVLSSLEEAIEHERIGVQNGDGGAAKRIDRLENLLQNLYPLSFPCCRIDASRLSRGDTTPTVFIAAGNRSESKTQELLRLPAQPGVIDNDGSQFALLQAVYAFPSLAVAGMETLRQAYEARDRQRSFPHIQREWNQKDLKVSRQGELTDPEILQFARARAVSELFEAASPNRGNGRGKLEDVEATEAKVHLPGIRIYDDAPAGAETAWLLRYERNPGDGQWHLRGRAAEPVPGHHRVWKIAPMSDDLQALDLDQNIRHYISSAVRESHERLLSGDVYELERGDSRDAYAAAYEGYAGKLLEIAATHRERGRRDEERLYARVARVLQQYVHELRSADVPVP